MHQLIATIEKVQTSITPATLVAVTKTHTSDVIRAAFAAGVRHFGENYVQEAVQKIQKLADLTISWHFIGAIQSNKTQIIAQNFSWVQTIDREIIAKRLNAQRPDSMPPLQVLLQVNIDDEASKSGVSADHLFTLADYVSTLPRLTLRGLMIIPKPLIMDPRVRVETLREDDGGKCEDDKTRLLATFAHAKQLFLQLQQRYTAVDTLSMGMSDDYLLAVAAGSNMVRLGSVLFGKRK